MAYVQSGDDGELMICDNWYEFDIVDAAWEEFEVTLTRPQIDEVMHIIVDGFDANIGINWDVIHQAIGQIINKPTKE